MDKKSYELLLKEEHSYEKKLSLALKKAEKLLQKAHQDADEEKKLLLTQEMQRLTKELAQLEKQQQETISSYETQSKKQQLLLQKKEPQLATTAKDLTKTIIQKWNIT